MSVQAECCNGTVQCQSGLRHAPAVDLLLEGETCQARIRDFLLPRRVRDLLFWLRASPGREAELMYGCVVMLASLGFLVGESDATPLFGGQIGGIVINLFWQVPKAFCRRQVPKASSRTTHHRGARSFPRAPQLDGANRGGELFPAPDALVNMDISDNQHTKRVS